jgi:hypothetical protein
MRRAVLCVCLLSLSAGAGACASAPINKAATADLAKADALVAEGCYDCLTEARDIYARIAVGKARPLVLPRLFETTVLLGLRDKELARSPAKQFDAAAAMVPELPATYSAKAYLDIANAILPDNRGTPGPELATFKRPGNDQVTTWKTSLEAGQGGIAFRQYLSSSLDCVVTPIRPRGAPANSAVVQSSGTEPPLVVYRRANCPRADAIMLGGMVEADPRFVEAGVLAYRVRSTQPTSKEIAAARTWLTAGFAKWPDSTVVTYALGALNQTVGDCRTALSFYDKTLALKPAHEEAHFGRLVCLSYLKQHDPAIVEATGMIAAKNNEGEATYWRAWNKHETGQLKEARIDSDRMKTILYHDRALTLAGQIEYDMDDLNLAETDLKDAAHLNPNNCIAPWYLGLVQLKRQAWTPTADAFVDAMGCYRIAVAYDREKPAEMQKADNVDETFRASQIAGFEAAIKDDSAQVSASAFNAAVNYARANNREKALEYCDLAAKDPDRVKQVEQLRALIVK